MHIFGLGVLSFRQSWLEASVNGMGLYVYDNPRGIKIVASGILDPVYGFICQRYLRHEILLLAFDSTELFLSILA